jgi:hypothetical protein
MINSSAIEPETTTTLEPTTTVPRLAGRGTPAPVIKKVAAAAPTPSSTTTTTKAPATALRIAQAEVGKTGPSAEGGFWWAKFVSWTAEQAKVPDFISRDGPSALYTDGIADGRLTQEPVIGGMVFIDLFGPEGNGYGQATHAGILESVNVDELTIIQGNGNPDPSVVTRTTFHLNDGYVIGFAPFEMAA